MSAYQKLISVGVIIGIVCVTILYTILFFSLWAYREEVAGSLLFLLVLVVLVHLRGKVNEQNIKQRGFNPNQEIPFDQYGEPAFLPPGAQKNEYRQLRDQNQLPVYSRSQQRTE